MGRDFTFNGEKHGPQLCEPLGVHCSHTLHVLLGGQHQLVVHEVVGRVAQAKERRGGVQVAGHARQLVDVLADALDAGAEEGEGVCVYVCVCCARVCQCAMPAVLCECALVLVRA